MAADGSPPRALLGRYELRQQVGSGGMGEVWLGWDRRLQRDVAVKRLLPQISDEPTFRQRFEVEARTAATLDHPNVVSLYDIDEDEGSLFIVMERLPGPSLDRRIAAGPLAEEEVLRVASDMLLGLEAAHAAHLIHRDIKPGNLIRSAGGRWKIGDFGVAKDLASTAQLTLVGVAVGTPAYLAPEQLEGRPASVATDIWAAAVVLREAITGHRPFVGDDPIAVAHAVRHTRLVPLAHLRPDIDAHLTGAIDRTLLSDASHRFASAAEMRDVIEGRAPVVAAAMPSSVAIGAHAGAAGGDPSSTRTPGETGPVAPADGRPVAPEASNHPRLTRLLWLVIAIGAALLLLLLVVVLAEVLMSEEDEPAPPAPTTVVDGPREVRPDEAPDTESPPDREGFQEERPTTTDLPRDSGTEEPDRRPPSEQPDVVGPGGF